MHSATCFCIFIIYLWFPYIYNHIILFAEIGKFYAIIAAFGTTIDLWRQVIKKKKNLRKACPYICHHLWKIYK